MDIQTKNIISFSLLVLVLTGCSTTGGTGQHSNTENEDIQTTTTTTEGGSIMHTHSGIPHTHVLPATGLSHSHNYNTTKAPINRPAPRQPAPVRAPAKPATCKPCVTRAYKPQRSTYTPPRRAVQASGNCHMHQSRRHCHALPASGTNHSHNQQARRPVARPAAYRPPVRRPVAQPVRRPVQPVRRPVVQPVRRPVVQPVRRPVVQPRRPAPQTTTTYYDYSGSTTKAPAPKPAPTYYNYNAVKVPSRKGLTPHIHNGKTHNHVLPAAGRNHTHDTATSYSGGRSPSYYDGGHTTAAPAPTSTASYGSTASSVSANNGSTYTVKPKDTVFQVMRNTGVYWKTIIKINNLQAPDYTIAPGQILRLK
ncbi:MAG: LysM peptidoglycan-binding domain-containing protein [Thiotrichaceae bacterium]|nr:LysM peptidoglycan-binding domain-containing protein [Thiotrichaceae bacterium]